MNISSVVNVASIPQRSPFRYPGGKTWLVPQVRLWLNSFPVKPQLFIEPFTGGGIIGLTVAFENLADRVLLVELDERISSVWKTMLDGNADWLADRILDFEMNKDSLNEELNKSEISPEQMAFTTILRNRASHGGIMAPGAGLIKHGENGKGIKSRWYPKTLANRIRSIGTIRSRISFIWGDGMDCIREHANDRRVVFFIDPPYTLAGKKAGARLYKHNEIDHEQLFDLVDTIKGDFLLTYDNADEVRLLAAKHGFEVAEITMKNTHNSRMSELLIGRNLKWLENNYLLL